MFSDLSHFRLRLERDVAVKTTFLGAFTKFRKATISFVMSVRMEQLGSHWTGFHEI
jgi:hypothetical protein